MPGVQVFGGSFGGCGPSGGFFVPEPPHIGSAGAGWTAGPEDVRDGAA